MLDYIITDVPKKYTECQNLPEKIGKEKRAAQQKTAHALKKTVTKASAAEIILKPLLCRYVNLEPEIFQEERWDKYRCEQEPEPEQEEAANAVETVQMWVIDW